MSEFSSSRNAARSFLRLGQGGGYYTDTSTLNGTPGKDWWYWMSVSLQGSWAKQQGVSGGVFNPIYSPKLFRDFSHPRAISSPDSVAAQLRSFVNNADACKLYDSEAICLNAPIFYKDASKIASADNQDYVDIMSIYQKISKMNGDIIKYSPATLKAKKQALNARVSKIISNLESFKGKTIDMSGFVVDEVKTADDAYDLIYNGFCSSIDSVPRDFFTVLDLVECKTCLMNVRNVKYSGVASRLPDNYDNTLSSANVKFKEVTSDTKQHISVARRPGPSNSYKLSMHLGSTIIPIQARQEMQQTLNALGSEVQSYIAILEKAPTSGFERLADNSDLMKILTQEVSQSKELKSLLVPKLTKIELGYFMGYLGKYEADIERNCELASFMRSKRMTLPSSKSNSYLSQYYFYRLANAARNFQMQYCNMAGDPYVLPNSDLSAFITLLRLVDFINTSCEVDG